MGLPAPAAVMLPVPPATALFIVPVTMPSSALAVVLVADKDGRRAIHVSRAGRGSTANNAFRLRLFLNSVTFRPRGVHVLTLFTPTSEH
eukprot:2523193-Prymnesium_polylepis.1